MQLVSKNHIIKTIAVLGTSMATVLPASADGISKPSRDSVEREIPAAQGSHTAPDGDTIVITSKCLRRNGKAVIPIMGEMHHARVPAAEWRDYLRKMKAGGVTIVADYVFWIHHEEKEGEFNFSDRRDVRRFLQTCKEEGLDVVLRIGPWCHGECRNGGFPAWAVEKFQKRLRTADPAFLKAVENYWSHLFKEVDGYLFKQGGPVIGLQIENECSGPWPYMMALKNLAVKCGFDVPFYTRTGWPAMRGKVDFGEILPLFGDYADGFWDRDLKNIAPGNHKRAFKFSDVRVSANIATEQLPQSLADDKATGQYPFFTCELGGGMASSYHRRVRIWPMDTYAMALVKLGCGSNLLGYYMYAGGTNPNRPAEGVFFNECQDSAYTNHNDLPSFSYEFFAPISEFGETTGVWGLLSILHKFCASFADDFVLAEPEIVSEREAIRGPFHFHNEWVRGGDTSKIPHIFPSNWKTRLGTIKSATVQPVEWDGDTLVMMIIPGIEPSVEFDGEPFAIRYIEFPSLAASFPYVPKTPLDISAQSALIRAPSAQEREIKTGPRGVALQPSEADWLGAAEFSISLPDNTPRDAILEVDYLGDCARVYVDGQCVADDFFKDTPLRCALWRIPNGSITMRIMPWTDSPLIYIEPPERPTESGARINSIRVVSRD